ncbi:hypothetical protein EK21DRAFT_103458 [Setomelanomma holmii]|uniref:C2H2-type domain-containing protein n=1 Tax=Setomelanomma holmii TaxID=210430 RepID=A0A9P4LJ06_9PLEO|nr:hypothetical protein EK21DRAFT_103458 [Setomelanomma holmii]
MNALDHWGPRYECDTCDREFFIERSAERHMDDKGHWKPQFSCETCSRKFFTQESADQHMNALSHHKRHFCHDCSKFFQTENALKMHLNSSTHRGKNIAGLSHHLETGSCPRAKMVNHRTIYQALSRRDPGGLLTNKLLTYSDTNIQNIATAATWNGSSYECYLCHRGHVTLHALNQHLNSPVHSEKRYHCPNRSCDRYESRGFVRFEKVQKHVHNFITGRQKLLGFA